MKGTIINCWLINLSILVLFLFTGMKDSMILNDSTIFVVIHKVTGYTLAFEIMGLALIIGYVVLSEFSLKIRMSMMTIDKLDRLTSKDKQNIEFALDNRKAKVKSKVSKEQFSLYCELVAVFKFSKLTVDELEKLKLFLKNGWIYSMRKKRGSHV